MKGVAPRTSLSKENLLRRGIPRLFLNANIDQYDIDDRIKNIIRNYLDNIDIMYEDCVNMLLHGSNGSGKSYCASLIVKEAYVQRYSSLIITFQSLLDLQFKDDETKEKGIEDYQNAEFLVIDELGKEIQAKSGYNLTMLEELLRTRDTKGFPTIICTNMELEDLYSRYGNSVASLMKGNFIKIEFKDGDYRQSVTKERRGIRVLLEDGKLVAKERD